jgi:hypothetical protein
MTNTSAGVKHNALWKNLLVPRSIELADPELQSYGMRVQETLTVHKEQTGDLGDPLVGRRDR